MSEESSLGPGETPSLRRYGSFLVAYSAGLPLPRLLEIEGDQWHRFMDKIYSPSPIAELSTELVLELCDLRLDLDSEVINRRVHKDVTTAAIELAASLSPSARTVLDFGIGDGRNVAKTRQSFDDAIVFGCDMSARALASASRHGDVVRVAPYGPLPFRDSSIDLVLCLFVLHFAIPKNVLNELLRSIVEGGYLIGNVYGPAVSGHRATLRRVGFEAVMSVPVIGAKGHSVDVWAAP